MTNRFSKIQNRLYYLIGLLFLIVSCIRHRLFGYKTPRTFSSGIINKVVKYDLDVVTNWQHHLNDYQKSNNTVQDKVLLELGPGPDIGTGLYLLAAGARRYIAFDAHNLVNRDTSGLYEAILGQIKESYPNADSGAIADQVKIFLHGESDRLSYIVDKNFNPSKINERVDIIVSQAAFEHFSNFEVTIEQLNSIVNPGALLVSEVDLKTHTSIIRDWDPLNIYRYGDFVWNAFRFSGSPNRMRTHDYRAILERYGWSDIQIYPLDVLDAGYVDIVKPSLGKKFKQLNAAELTQLSVMIMARKK